MKIIHRLISILILATFAFAAAPAFADGMLFTPVPGDKSISGLIIPIFGGDLLSATSYAGGSGSTPFETAAGALSGIALALGGLLTGYMLVVGTMHTAHDAELLGKRWSATWIPIRTAIGVALTVPVAGGGVSGYCGAQLIVGWLIFQGIGAADSEWSTYAQTAFSQTGQAPTSVVPNVDALASGILKSEVCMSAVNYLSTKDPAAASVYPSNFAASDLPNGRGRQYGSTVTNADQCGVVFYSATTNTSAAPAQGGSVVSTSFADAIGDVNALTGKAATLRAAHIEAVAAMEAALQPLADQLVQGKQPDPNAYQQAIMAYQTSISTKAGQLFGTTSAYAEVQQSATQDGWLLAGAWMTKASAMADAQRQAVSAVPSVRGPAPMGSLIDGEVALAYRSLDVFKNKTVLSLGIGNDVKLGNPDDSMFGELTGKISAAVTDSIFSHLTPDPSRNALMSIKDIGDWTMVAGETAIGADLGGVLLLDGAGAIVKFFTAGFADPIPHEALLLTGGLLLGVGVTIFSIGGSISVVTPMMPFIIFFGTALGWLLLVGEAVIVAPFWAIMHLQPEGEGIGSQTRQGYMLLLGLTLRPPLIVAGFILTLSALDPILHVFMSIFLPALKAGMGNSFVGLGTFIIGMMLFAYSVAKIILIVFSWIYKTPDMILRWIGGGAEQLGESGGGMAKHGSGAAAAVGGAVGGAVGSAGRGAGAVAARTRMNDRSAESSRAASGNNEPAFQQKRRNASAEAPSADTATRSETGKGQNAGSAGADAMQSGSAPESQGRAAEKQFNPDAAVKREEKTDEEPKASRSGWGQPIDAAAGGDSPFNARTKEAPEKDNPEKNTEKK